jgi:hypothetical protein
MTALSNPWVGWLLALSSRVECDEGKMGAGRVSVDWVDDDESDDDVGAGG